ncbi:MAG: putative sporulation protein YtxC [Thermosediminibacteraceae bacterium]|nr:putative sporulation protein YtxC [Thermosediminibacteraceae bacterium]
MRLLTVGIIKPFSSLEERFCLELEDLKTKRAGVSFRKKVLGSSIFYDFAIAEEIFVSLVEILADLVIDLWEPKLIKRIIKKFFYFTEAENKIIYDFAREMLNYPKSSQKGTFPDRSKRKSVIIHKLLDYFRGCDTVILEGFINFRLKEYIEMLEEVIDKAVDEYLVEKEYREFINLLKFIVYVNDPREELVHVLLSNGEFHLMNGNMEPLERDEGIDILAKENPDFSLEDIALSMLINLAPQKIVIHGFNGIEKSELVNVIYNIFEDRVYFCNDCEICINSKRGKK